MVIGALLGGFSSGFLNGRLKVQINKGPHISNRNGLILAFIGGAIMAFGAAHDSRLLLRDRLYPAVRPSICLVPGY